MMLIPVIDLMRGQVVRGVRGMRHLYRPIVSALCGSSDPVTVARILCSHCAARTLYIADLDALQGGAVQSAVLREVIEALPDVELWLDAGFADAAQAAAVQRALKPHALRLAPVFGSESLRDPAALAGCFVGRSGRASNALLSLDSRNGAPLDRADCWHSPSRWPQRVIVMTLERVGSEGGPDLATLAEVRRRGSQTLLFGAGGIRHAADLASAQATGAQGWLVASALHDLQIPPMRAA